MNPCLSRLLAALLCAAAPCLCTAESPHEFLGKVMPPEPEGCTTLGGHVFGPGLTKLLKSLKFKNEYFALFLDLSHREGKKAYFKVRTVHKYPKIPPGYRITDEGHCSDAQAENDPLLLAIVQWKDKKDGQFASQVLKAWRVDSNTGQFVEVNGKNVKCSFYWP